MIIHQEGEPINDPRWWVGLHIHCDCGCKFELTAEDHLDVGFATLDGEPSVCVFCPNRFCRKVLNRGRSEAKPAQLDMDEARLHRM